MCSLIVDLASDLEWSFSFRWNIISVSCIIFYLRSTWIFGVVVAVIVW